jgi:hypothetical protein
MNLLCPNCQKMLTVPDEFAGQLMKCPMCAGTFTVPGLPGAAPPPPPPPEVYTIRQEAPPAPPPPPIFSREPPPSTATTSTPPPPPSLPSLPPEGYSHSVAVWLSPRVLPWIAPACLLLVFVLQFFNWVGLYPGGVPAATQNAWQAAFGYVTPDGDMKEKYVQAFDEEKYKPGFNVLTFFYLLLFFFLVLPVTVASVVYGMVPLKLPPAVESILQNILPWRWLMATAANLILFLFLFLQLLLGFSLDNRYAEWVDKQVETKGTKTTQQQKTEAAERGILMDYLNHTYALRLAVILHLVAIVCSALMFWVSRRGTHRPMPKMELVW